MFELATLTELAPNAFLLVGGVFAAVFMILVFLIFVKALMTQNLGDIFKESNSNRLSMAKFWANIGYCAATIAFLALNINQSDKTGGNIDMIWLIYLGTVAGNNLASKWLTLKFGQTDSRAAPIVKTVKKATIGDPKPVTTPDEPDK